MREIWFKNVSYKGFCYYMFKKSDLIYTANEIYYLDLHLEKNEKKTTHICIEISRDKKKCYIFYKATTACTLEELYIQKDMLSVVKETIQKQLAARELLGQESMDIHIDYESIERWIEEELKEQHA